LQEAREAVLWKAEGLSEYDVRRPLTPTGTNLLGLVKHLAAVDGTAVGTTSGLPAGDGTVELHSVWVATAVRGRGLRGLLLGAVEEWARRTGAARLRLGVLAGNAEAREMYLRRGFVVEGRDGEGEGAELRMTKRVER
ncbi:GNAT family N-acetyltransferase, partial [Streptomyces evansiae]|uniref:GNAT family N-acetyltransferase n=1 Tax=Streptomyces evansiae TaxID=3075535 RepID=UPI002885A47C